LVIVAGTVLGKGKAIWPKLLRSQIPTLSSSKQSSGGKPTQIFAEVYKRRQHGGVGQAHHACAKGLQIRPFFSSYAPHPCLHPWFLMPSLQPEVLPMTHIEEAIIERLLSGGPCGLDDVVTALPNFSWGELFVAVDCMSRDGRVSLIQIGYSTYQISLARGSRIQAPLRRAEVEGV
jgi:hypothetical protein